MKIFEKSDGEIESTGAPSAALLSGVFQRELDLTNSHYWDGNIYFTLGRKGK